jgi:hypothetical protein
MPLWLAWFVGFQFGMFINKEGGGMVIVVIVGRDFSPFEEHDVMMCTYCAP